MFNFSIYRSDGRRKKCKLFTNEWHSHLQKRFEVSPEMDRTCKNSVLSGIGNYRGRYSGRDPAGLRVGSAKQRRQKA